MGLPFDLQQRQHPEVLKLCLVTSCTLLQRPGQGLEAGACNRQVSAAISDGL